MGLASDNLLTPSESPACHLPLEELYEPLLPLSSYAEILLPNPLSFFFQTFITIWLLSHFIFTLHQLSLPLCTRHGTAPQHHLLLTL